MKTGKCIIDNNGKMPFDDNRMWQMISNGCKENRPIEIWNHIERAIGERTIKEWMYENRKKHFKNINIR